jgi:hypothetical protein
MWTGDSLKFDGVNDKVVVPKSTSLQFSNAFSVEFAITFSAIPTQRVGIIGKGGTTTSEFEIYINDTHTGISVWSGSPPNALGWANSLIAQDLNIKTHYILTRVDNTLILYKNGVSLGGKTTTSPLVPLDANLLIGQGYTYYTSPDTSISLVRIYDRALTDAEVQSNYLDATAVVEPAAQDVEIITSTITNSSTILAPDINTTQSVDLTVPTMLSTVDNLIPEINTTSNVEIQSNTISSKVYPDIPFINDSIYGYKIERRIQGEPIFMPLVFIEGDLNNFIDKRDLIAGAIYEYRIKQVYLSEETSYSAIVTLTYSDETVEIRSITIYPDKIYTGDSFMITVEAI